MCTPCTHNYSSNCLSCLYKKLLILHTPEYILIVVSTDGPGGLHTSTCTVDSSIHCTLIGSNHQLFERGRRHPRSEDSFFFSAAHVGILADEAIFRCSAGVGSVCMRGESKKGRTAAATIFTLSTATTTVAYCTFLRGMNDCAAVCRGVKSYCYFLSILLLLI